MDKYIFAANTNLSQRLKNNEMLTSYQIGLIDSSTPFRNELFMRNIGRLTGLINPPQQFEQDTEEYTSYKSQLKGSGRWKKLDRKSKKEFNKIDKANKKATDQYNKEAHRNYLNNIKAEEENTKSKYEKLFNTFGIGEKYVINTDIINMPANVYFSENEEMLLQDNSDFPGGLVYKSKLLGIRADINNISGLNTLVDVFDENNGKTVFSNQDSYERNYVFSKFGNDVTLSSLENKVIFDAQRNRIGVIYGADREILSKKNDFYSPNDNWADKLYEKETTRGRTNFQYSENEITFNSLQSDGRLINNLNTVQKGDGLLDKTNNLFSESKVKTMINRFYNNSLDDKSSDIIESARDRDFGISRGRNLLKEGKYQEDVNGFLNPYCRVWTPLKEYSKLSDAIRSSGYDEYDILPEKGFRPNKGNKRLAEGSVLQSNGKARIAPTSNNSLGPEGISKCMFSIENLAWKDYYENKYSYDAVKSYEILNDSALTPEEKKIKISKLEKTGNMLSEGQKGPNGGRIMWFPPYGLTFNENVQTEWNANRFIGRGENIYNYVNTERSGNLSFTLLIDHPSSLNVWKNKGLLDKTITDGYGSDEVEDDLLRYFAGCKTKFENEDLNEKQRDEDRKEAIELMSEETYQTEYTASIYFPPLYSGFDDTIDYLVKYLKYGYGPYYFPFKEVLKNGYEYTENGISYSYSGEPFGEEKYCYRVDNFYKDKGVYYNHGENKTDNNSYFLNTGKNKDYSTIPEEERDKHLFFSNLSDIFLKKNLDDDKNKSFIMDLKDAKKIIINTNGWSTPCEFKLHEGNDFSSVERECKQMSIRRAYALNKIINEIIKSVNSEADIEIKEPSGQIGYPNYGSTMKTYSETFKQLRKAKSEIIIIRTHSEDYILNSNPDENEARIMDLQKFAEGKINKDSKILVQSIDTVEDTKEMNYDDEYLYFSKLEKEDNQLYQKLKTKVKYFNPAFHSITPEGFNARLTFLNQCTRQGPTNSANELSIKGGANNLAFGRPPYCVLRLGDFFNTKIIIESITVDYGEGGATQWDLNPDGAGVQPMLAKVTLNFKFLGGSDLSGPIEQLQNAVSFNYYSNTSVYDRRSSIKPEENYKIENNK